MTMRKKTAAQKNAARRDAAEVAKLPALRAACEFYKRESVRDLEAKVAEYRYLPGGERMLASFQERLARVKRARMGAFRSTALNAAIDEIQTGPAWFLRKASWRAMPDWLLGTMTSREYRPLLR